MSLYLGAVYSTLELDSSKLGGQIASAKKHYNQLDDAIDNVGSTSKNSFGAMAAASAVGNLAALGLAKGIEAITGATRDAVSSLLELQNSRASFEVLTGSAEGANKVMADLANYANNTPFEFGEVARAGKTLLGFGVVAQDVGKYTRQLGDVVGATGGDFYSAARVFGQVSAAGRVMAEDYNQLIDNGIALGDVIAKELNIPMSELKDRMSEGKVTSEVFFKALEKATSEGGKFFGGAEKLAGTLNGRLSTLQDTFTGLVGTIVGVDFSTGIVDADGAFAKFSDTVKGATTLLGSAGFQKTLTDVRNNVFAFMGSVKETATTVFTYLQPALMAIWNTISTNLYPAIVGLIQSPFVQWLGTMIVGAANIALWAINGLGQALAFIITVLTPITPLLIGVTSAFVAYALITGTVTTALGLASVAMGIFNAVMNLNPVVLLTSLTIGLVAALNTLIQSTNNQTNAADRLKTANDNLKTSIESVQTAQQNLDNAQLSAKGSALAVERAQKTYNDTLAKYGEGALETREAAYQLEQAQANNAKANADVTKSTDELKKAQEDQAKKEKEQAAAKKAVEDQARRTAEQIERQRKAIQDVNLGLDNLNGKTVNYTVNAKLNSLTTGPQGRAVGGPVKRNTPYFVGENRDGTLNRTSELFVPGQNGRIVNSNDLQRLMRPSAPTGGVTPSDYMANTFPEREAAPQAGDTYYITMNGVNDPVDFTRQLKLATTGRGR